MARNASRSNTHVGTIPKDKINVPEPDPMSAYFELPGTRRPKGRGVKTEGASTGVYRRNASTPTAIKKEYAAYRKENFGPRGKTNTKK